MALASLIIANALGASDSTLFLFLRYLGPGTPGTYTPVVTYNAVTGTLINPAFPLSAANQTMMVAVLGNTLFEANVANSNGFTIKTYNLSDGSLINPEFIIIP